MQQMHVVFVLLVLFVCLFVLLVCLFFFFTQHAVAKVTLFLLPQDCFWNVFFKSMLQTNRQTNTPAGITIIRFFHEDWEIALKFVSFLLITLNYIQCTYRICKLHFTMQIWKHSCCFDYSWSYTYHCISLSLAHLPP